MAMTPEAADGVDLRRSDPISIYRADYLALVRLAVGFVGDRETAEDLVQDTFLRVEAKWPQIRDVDAASRYLRTSVVNAARDVLRRRRISRRLPWTTPTQSPGADETLLGQEDRSTVRSAVSRLPTRQREVITLRYLAELSIVETARTLGISEAAVKTSTRRALSALAQTLGEAP